MKNISVAGLDIRKYRVIISGAPATMCMASSPAAALLMVASAENVPASALRLDKRFGKRPQKAQ